MSTATRKFPPDPKTVAEMIPVREAELAARKPPECGKPYHGAAVPRELGQQTYEQMWCGVWYDCAARGCGTSWCISSRELAAFHGEPYDTGTGWEQWDGRRWQPVRTEIIEAFFAERAIERERMEKFRRSAHRRARKQPTA